MRALLWRAFVPPSWPDRLFYGALAVPAAMLVWQAFDRSPPVEILERSVSTPEVKACEFLRVRYHVRQRHEAEVTAYRRLYDGFGVVFDYDVRRLPPRKVEDGMEVYTTQIPIPCTAQPGAAKMALTACWERPFNFVHQIWPVCVTLKAIEFTIVR